MVSYLLKSRTGFSWFKRKHSRFGVVIKISNCLLLFGPYFASAWLILFKVWTRKSIPSTSRRHSRCVCFANSRVGHSINARNPFFFGFFKSRIIGTKNAAVFPLPVGAQAITDFPCLIQKFDFITDTFTKMKSTNCLHLSWSVWLAFESVSVLCSHMKSNW